VVPEMKKENRILYLNYTSILTQGILLSQVVIPLKKLASEGFSITLVSGERSEDLAKRQEREALHKDLEEAGVDLVFFRKALPPYLRVEAQKGGSSIWRAICFLYDQIRFFLLTGWLLLTKRCRILHARSYVPGLIGVFYKYLFGIRLIFDPRGILPEELRLAREWSAEDIRYRFWKFLEKFILKNSDSVLALSRPFRKHLLQIVPGKNIQITPCCIDPERFIYNSDTRSKMRAKLSFGDKFVLVYSIGCFVPYQVLEEALKLFHLLHDEHPDSQMLILTPEDEKIKNYAKKYGLNTTSVSIVRVPFSKVPDYLMACDAGLLVRHPSIVSKVASPVKFPEYLACGLPVIAFSGIGDTEAILERYSVGECVDHSDEESMRLGIRRLFSRIHGYGDGLREQCRNISIRFFSWDSYMPMYRFLYTRRKKK
jgi:glycosyltransferase involved in cell wall biosynthesis